MAKVRIDGRGVEHRGHAESFGVPEQRPRFIEGEIALLQQNIAGGGIRHMRNNILKAEGVGSRRRGNDGIVAISAI